jgi:hypothetical protein
VRTLIRRDFEKVFETCQAIVTPTAPTTAFKLGEKVTDPLEMYLRHLHHLVNLAACPACPCPGGFDSEGLPSASRSSANLRRETVLRTGYAYEQSPTGSKQPIFNGDGATERSALRVSVKTLNTKRHRARGTRRAAHRVEDFCGCSAKFGAAPNENTRSVSLPGVCRC